MRAIFGVSDGGGLERMRAALTSMLDWTTEAVPARGARRRRAEGHPAASPRTARVMGELDAVIARGDRAPPRGARPRRARRRALDAARRPPRGRRLADDRRRAARRARDAARRRPRDDGDRAVVGARAARPPPGRVGAAARGRRGLRGRGDQGDAAAAARAPDRAAPAQGADGDRRLGAPGGRLARCRASTSCTAGPTSTRTRSRSAPSASSSTPAGTYTWIPFGGGVRRCLGASFAQFEMAAVLRVLARRCARLEPDGLVPERTARRSITLVPAREGRCSSVAGVGERQRRLGREVRVPAGRSASGATATRYRSCPVDGTLERATPSRRVAHRGHRVTCAQLRLPTQSR